MTETINSEGGEQWPARQIAALVEGTMRLHLSRLDALLQVIHDSRAPVEAPAPVLATPLLLVDVTMAAVVFPEAAAAVFALDAGVEVAAWRWVHPRLEVGTAWPRTGELANVRLSARETAFAVLAQVPLDLGPVSASLGGGFVLCVIDAEAGIQTYRTVTVHPGARVRTELAVPIVDSLSAVVAVKVDVLPRYPEHTWRGEVIAERGPWRLSVGAGLRLKF